MFCCVHCFENSPIKKFIIENKQSEKHDCKYCGSKNTDVISLYILRKYFIECINKAYEYYDDNDSNILRYSLSEIFTDCENVFSSCTDYQQLLTDIFTKSLNSHKDALTDNYVNIESEMFVVKYDSIGLKGMDIYRAWEGFKFEVMHYNRFFDICDEQVRESYLWQLKNYFKPQIIPLGTVFYRARVPKLFPKDINDFDVYSEMGPPPLEKSGNGRMSPAGIVYLYLSDKKETALKECANESQNVLTAKFVTKKEMLIVDLSEDWQVDRLSIFDSDYDHNNYWIKQFISKFVSEISQPVVKSDINNKSYQYTLTQILAEYIRQQKFDGICYSSSKGIGKNYVFFFGSKLEKIPVVDKLMLRTIPYYKDYFDIIDVEKKLSSGNMKFKLAKWIFYRLYNGFTLVYNTKDKEINIYNATVKYLLDEFSKDKYINDEKVINNLYEKYVFEDDDKYRITKGLKSFISELTDNNIILKNNMFIDNPNTLEIQAKNSLISKNQLLSVQFEVTFRCQERCRYCYCVTDKPKKEELTTKEIKKLLDDLVDMNVLEIIFTGGDPFIRSDIHELLQYAYDKGLIVSIYTNGVAITDKDILFLKSLFIREINFTIFSHIPNKHDYFTQVKGSFNKTINVIQKCILVGIPVNIKIPAMNYNKEDIESVILLAEELGASIQVGFAISPKNDGNKEPTQYRLNKIEDYIQIMKQLDSHFIFKCSEDVFEARTNDEDIICLTGTQSININPYGEVFPCNPLLIKCGDIRQQSIKNIWENSSELKKVREFRFTDIKGCQDCEKQKWCTFCPGTSLTENGDPLMKYEEACMINEADTIMGKGGDRT